MCECCCYVCYSCHVLPVASLDAFRAQKSSKLEDIDTMKMCLYPMANAKNLLPEWPRIYQPNLTFQSLRVLTMCTVQNRGKVSFLFWLFSTKRHFLHEPVAQRSGSWLATMLVTVKLNFIFFFSHFFSSVATFCSKKECSDQKHILRKFTGKT